MSRGVNVGISHLKTHLYKKGRLIATLKQGGGRRKNLAKTEKKHKKSIKEKAGKDPSSSAKQEGNLRKDSSKRSIKMTKKQKKIKVARNLPYDFNSSSKIKEYRQFFNKCACSQFIKTPDDYFLHSKMSKNKN
jgi:hypothetical protein